MTLARFEEADARALEAAIAFREAQVGSGQARVQCRTEIHSGIKGVFWMAGQKAWMAQLTVGKKFYREYFRVKGNSPEELERARLAAVEKRREWEEKHICITVSKTPGSKKRSRT